MPAPYPKSGPVTLRTNLKDYPLTAALKSGKVSSPIVKFDFCGPTAVFDGFKPMVREAAYDAGELAIVTFLQAKAYNKPLTLLPATVVGKFQHGTLYYMSRGKSQNPRDIEGRSATVRAYTQTTGVWARGILQHEYGVDLGKVRWLTTDDPHLAEYRDPANVAELTRSRNRWSSAWSTARPTSACSACPRPSIPTSARSFPMRRLPPSPGMTSTAAPTSTTCSPSIPRLLRRAQM